MKLNDLKALIKPVFLGPLGGLRVLNSQARSHPANDPKLINGSFGPGCH